MKLLAHPVKTGQARLGLPGNVDMVTGSALTPLRESVTAFPAPAYRQEGLPTGRQAGHPADLTAIAILKDLGVPIFKTSGMPIIKP